MRCGDDRLPVDRPSQQIAGIGAPALRPAMFQEFLALAQLPLMHIGAARKGAALPQMTATCASGSRSRRERIVPIRDVQDCRSLLIRSALETYQEYHLALLRGNSREGAIEIMYCTSDQIPRACLRL